MNSLSSHSTNLFSLPSSPACVFDGILFIFLGVRGAGLILLVCLEISFIGIRLRTSRPPNDPELLVPCKSLSIQEENMFIVISWLFCILVSKKLSSNLDKLEV